MWLLERIRNKRKNKPEEKINSIQNDETYLQIADIITNNDTEVISEIKEGYAHPQNYIDKHFTRLSWYMLGKEMKGYVLNKWWLMIDVLELHHYICIRDWKDEPEDFLYFLFHTKRAILEKIEMDQLDLVLSQEGGILQWGKEIDEKLAGKNLVVGYIGTDGDEFTVFLCTKQELAALEARASSAKQLISRLSDESDSDHS